MTKEKIYYWPLWFSKLLSEAEQKKIKKIIPQLQRAQIYLWRALNIYDDFFDKEGKRLDLPQANTYFRKYLEIHYRLKLSNDYYMLLDKIFNKSDQANRNEILTSNSKNLDCIADKSLTLALGPLALLSYLNYKTTDKTFKAALNFFRYTLSAKQLSDDSHDWREDFDNGLTTYANEPIRRALNKRKLSKKTKASSAIIDLIFVTDASPHIITALTSLCLKARKEMETINKNPKNIILQKLIKPIENACNKAHQFQLLICQP